MRTSPRTSPSSCARKVTTWSTSASSRRRLGRSDPEVLDLAFGEDRVPVTASVGDFRKLAAAREIHAGLVLLLDGGLRRDEQLEVLRRVIGALETAGDLMNRALTMALDGGFTIEELPPS